jgi:putative heme-binding domain-containing protein
VEALDQGLSERGATLSGLGQGGLFEEVAEIQPDDTPAPQREYEPITLSLKNWIRETWKAQPRNLARTRLAIRSGLEEAYQFVLADLRASELPDKQRIDLLNLLVDLGRPDCVAVVFDHVDLKYPVDVRLRALDVLARFETNGIAQRLLDSYPRVSSTEQRAVRKILLSRRPTALTLLRSVDEGRLPAQDFTVTELRPLHSYADETITTLVRKHWGSIKAGSTEEKLAVMRRYRNDLGAAEGNAGQGRQLFIQHCASCHKLFGEGGTLGTDLSEANRSDQAALLAAVVDPSAAVRSEYLTYIIRTRGGRTVRGVLEQEDTAAVTIVDGSSQRTRIARSDIQSMEVAPESLMPEDLLSPLSPQQLRDLFRYLQQTSR